MSMKPARAWLALAAIALSACAQAPFPVVPPIEASPPGGRVAVGQALNLFDASGSQADRFAAGRAVLESLVGVMPEGRYEAGQILFGGAKRESVPLAVFDRDRLARAAREASFLEGTTPIGLLLETDVAALVAGGQDRAALVLISDGIATDYVGRTGVDEDTLASARALAESRSGETCFHTIQTGDEPAGAAFMQALAATTECGSYRTSASLSTAAALQTMSREIYLGAPVASPTPVTAVVGDADGDGVPDDRDECPGTLAGARVDERGCWTLTGLQFAVNGAEIEAADAGMLEDVIAVLSANPDVRIRIDGHSDSDGPAAYNQDLSERRAASVRDFLVEQGGLAEDRFEVRGFGESEPVAPNDSAANKRLNRRVELTILE